MITAYIALGSNLGEPERQLRAALTAMERLDHCELLACSPVYRSTAVGPGRQPDYLNAVAALNTRLEPLDLLGALQAIESAQGRRRGMRWEARTLDLDILLYGDLAIHSDALILPHPRLQERNFVIFPLHDLCPDLTLPCGTSIASLFQRSSAAGLEALGRLDDVIAGQEI